MQPNLSVGAELASRLAESSTELVGCVGLNRFESNESIAERVAAALDTPIEYPQLEDALTPDDRITLVPSVELPHGAEVVSALVDYLVEAQIDPRRIVVVLPASTKRSGETNAGVGIAEVDSIVTDFRDELLQWLDSEIKVEIHDPDNEIELAYLAADAEGRPIVLNRHLVEADVVIPIGLFRTGAVPGYFGMFDSVYPRLSNRETQARFSDTKALDPRGRHRKRLVAEADHIGWLLGSLFTVQLIPGPEATVADILVGQVEPVRSRAIEVYTSFWHHQIDRPVDLAILVLDPGPSRQNWQQLGEALSGMENLLRPEGSVAVCTRMVDPPGDAIDLIRDAPSHEVALEQIRQSSLPDAAEALQLASILEKHSLFLLSGIDPYLIEEYGIAPVESIDELVRLADRFDATLLINGAPFPSITLHTGEAVS